MADRRSAFGAELRRRRLARGLSLNGLSKLVYYSKGHLSKIENGLASAHIERAWQLDNVLEADGDLVALLQDAEQDGATAEPPPSGLPSPPWWFVGRDAELAALVSRLSLPGHSSVTCVVDGMAGLGKTTLAVMAAQSLTARFPDGCLFLDMHGYTGNVPPLSSGEALSRLLERLGLPVSPDTDERSARFRDHLSRHRILLVLDNAASAEQIRPLIPPPSGARLLVTSRSRLSSLDSAFHLSLQPLPEPDAAELLRSALSGEHDDGDIDKIVKLCGGLPLALTIMAARAQLTPLEVLADCAAVAPDKLSEIEDGERNVRSSIGSSYMALPTAHRAVFAVLGLYPGRDWTAHQAAALADTEVSTAARDMERLFGARLVERRSAVRFGFHDLVGEFARVTADAELSESVRVSAYDRLFVWTLDMAARADRLVNPGRYRPPVATTHRPAPFTDDVSAAAWLADEQPNLVAVCRLAFDRGADRICWQLAALLRGRFFQAKQWDDWLATHRWALTAVCRTGDRAGEAMTRNNLGLALMEIGRLEEADEQFLAVLGAAADVEPDNAWANALANHASVLYYRGHHGESLRLNQRALAFYLEKGNDRNVAITRRSIGLVELELGRFDEAVRQLTAALAHFSAPGGPLALDAVMTLNCLGEALLRSGAPENAASWFDRAVKGSKDCASLYEEARALRGLGEIAFSQGRLEEAAECWRQAFENFTDLGAVEAEGVSDLLASLRGVSRGSQHATASHQLSED